MKGRFTSNQCIKFGQWEKDHNDDGTLRQGVNLSDTPINTGSNGSSKRGKIK